MSEALEAWSGFHAAMAGATAALAGLVIVAASVNIDKIVTSRILTARLGSAIVVLVVALAVSGLGLVPAIPLLWLGLLTLVLVAAALVFQVRTARLIAMDPDAADRARVAKSALGFVPIAAYLVAGVLLVAGMPAGLYAAAAGTIVAIVAAIVVSWVALVEVLR